MSGYEAFGLVDVSQERYSRFSEELEKLCEKHGVLFEARDCDVFDYETFRQYCIEHGMYFSGCYSAALGYDGTHPNEVKAKPHDHSQEDRREVR